MRASLRSISLLALVGVAAAVPALAQTAPSGGLSQYPACTTKPSDADTNAAHGAYMAGKGSYDEGDYARAIDYFKDAYRRDCTKHELLVIIARAYELKGEKREAVNALETYVARAPNAGDVEVQKRKIANLKKEIADQAATASASAPASAPASATASAPGSAAPSASAAPIATVAPTATATSEAPAKEHSIVPWVVVAGGGALLVTGGVLYVVGAGDVSNAEQACGSNHVCPPGPAAQSSVDKGNQGRSLETVGVIVGGVGLGAIAGGLIWHFMEPTGSTAPQTGKPVIAPTFGPGYAGAAVGGRF